MSPNQANRVFLQWAKQLGFNPKAMAEHHGLPSEREIAPTLDDLTYLIADCELDGGKEVPYPDQVYQFWLSQWAGTQVPINHELIKNRAKWLDILRRAEFDDVEPTEFDALLRLVTPIAGPDLRENLPDMQEIHDHLSQPVPNGDMRIVTVNGQPWFLLAGDAEVAFMDRAGDVKVFDYDGHRVRSGDDLSRLQNHMVQRMKMSRPITEPGELASLLGNTLAGLIEGQDSISVLDLP
jgi:hypothetical protein